MSKSRTNAFASLIDKGEDNAVSMGTLSRLSELSPREVRKQIEELRVSGFLVCSNENGYFVPTTEAELKEWYRRTMIRVRTTLSTLEPVTHYLNEASEDPILLVFINEGRK